MKFNKEEAFLNFLEAFLGCAREVLKSEEDFYIFRFHLHPYYDNYDKQIEYLNSTYKHNPPLKINAVQQRFTRAKNKVLECVRVKTKYPDKLIAFFWEIVADLYM